MPTYIKVYIQASCNQIEQGETEMASLEFPKWFQTETVQSTGQLDGR